MKYLVAFSCILAASLALPLEDIAEVYFGDDTAGNYNLRLKSKAIKRDEERNQDGSVIGSYFYTDPEGTEHKVIYVAAGEKGFIANSADIPKPVPEGDELIQARINHLAILDAEHAKYPNGVPEEEPVPLADVLAKLVLPEIATLPEEAVPAEDEEAATVKAVHLAEYQRILAELAEIYTRLSQ